VKSQFYSGQTTWDDRQSGIGMSLNNVVVVSVYEPTSRELPIGQYRPMVSNMETWRIPAFNLHYPRDSAGETA